MNEGLPLRHQFALARDLPKVNANSARLYGIIARNATKAVIFRRGPSKVTRLIVWNLNSDTLEYGQWIRARIYERRCDLSPDGKYLVYFAANHRPPFGSWTAVSRPPWFTALALWEKGDCWGGGGLFSSSIRLCLNHRQNIYHAGIDEWKLQEGFRLPKSFIVEPLHENAGWGEDDPIQSMRSARDGWRPDTSHVEAQRNARGARFWITYDPPLTQLKSIETRRKRAPMDLRVHLHAVNEAQSRWLVETADIADENGAVLRSLGRIDWADLDHNGDVLYGAEGCLYRLPVSRAKSSLAALEPVLIADLNDMAFEPIAPPVIAKKWK